jgi:predicted nucleic acid-binding protein
LSGEAETIALALEKGMRIILDDRKARGVAARLGLSITGTVGLLIKAKQAGVIPALKPLLELLQHNNFHIGKELVEEALRLANE